NRARVPKSNFPLHSRARGSVRCEMAVDLPFPLLPPAIATAREELLPHADRARRLLRCAKDHPGCVRAQRRPTRLHAYKIAETNRVAELAPALPLILRQVATNNVRRLARISASAPVAVVAPNLPFANVCEARHRRIASPTHPS